MKNSYPMDVMGLRDWLAGQALNAMPHFAFGTAESPDEIARNAYMIADAMLRERKRSEE